MSEELKTRYTDAELAEFKELIQGKLDEANRDFDMLRANLNHSDNNDTEDTSPTFKVMEEGASVLSKEESSRLAQRQQKFIQNLEAALVRIANRSYGVCRQTGVLIPKERLKAVPHATLTIAAKENRR